MGNIIRHDQDAPHLQDRVYGKEGVGPCMTSGFSNTVKVLLDDMRIRNLTPRECFRLQGWSDDKFEKAQFVNSDSQLYKQAGNGVTVTVIYEIAKRLKEVDGGEAHD